jgi:hypothetical protein
LLESFDPAHDVDQSIHRADLVERDAIRGQSVYASFCFAQELEGAYRTLPYPGREFGPLHDGDQLPNVPMWPGRVAVVAIMVGPVRVTHGLGRFFPAAIGKNDIGLGGSYPTAIHRSHPYGDAGKSQARRKRSQPF